MAKAKKIREHHTVATIIAENDDHDSDMEIGIEAVAADNNNMAITDLTSIEATAEIALAVEELKRLEDLKKKLLNLEDGYRQKVMNFIGLHQQLKSGNFTLATWKTHNRKSFDSASFKTEFPDLHSSYLKDISVRLFRLY